MNELLNFRDIAVYVTYGAYAVSGVALLWGASKIKARIELSLAKHPSLAGHPRNAKRIAAMLPRYHYSEQVALGIDGASADVIAMRRIAIDSLSAQFRSRYFKSLAHTSEATEGLSDLQFVSTYRVPCQFKLLVDQGLKIPSFMQSAVGVTLTDLDGNTFYDLTGSYGVNVFGNDFYKRAIDEGADAVRELGPVLGSYHPVVVDNVARLKAISGMDEVSFHMSGTEAVMQAVRLAQYRTGRDKVLRFCGSYHGWWGDVQPGIGNPITERGTFTLAEMSENTLRVLRNRSDIACVLVNPLQALHPNSPAPSDSSLLDSSRKAGFIKAEYTAWLQQLRRICDAKGIALIFDEVFVGFRLSKGGAQDYFGVRADMVTYGKTLGGGLPVGVVCGQSVWMKRFNDKAPGDICFARGTFNSHPYVMGAMNVFLKHLESADATVIYADLESLWDERAAYFNARLKAAGVPVQVAHLSSIWTVLYTQPGCYNWLLQHYLRLEGIALSWVGTGRIVFSLNYSQAQFEAVTDCFVQAAQKMQQGGWWSTSGELSNKSIKRRVLREMLQIKLKW